MSYKLLKLISEYNAGAYDVRLELGDSALNAPVDIRFIDEPGWIENVHSVFFSMDGTDIYDEYDTGSKISTSTAGDLVFFDPSNSVGRTLTQLYSGGASLWEDDPLNAWLSTSKNINLKTHSVYGVTELDGTSTQNLTVQSGTGRSLMLMANGQTVYIWDTTLSAKFDSSAVTLYRDLNISNDSYKIWQDGNDLKFKDVNNATGKTLTELATGGGTGLWQSPGTETELIAPENINLNGYAIMNCGDIKLSTGTAVSNAIDFSTGASNYIQRIVYDAGYATIYRADTIHTWSIGINERMYLDNTNLKMFCNILMNGLPIYGGTASGNDLYLRSTSDATKGSIMLDSPLDFGGAGTHEIWNDGADLKFKDGNVPAGKTLTELATAGGTSLWEVDVNETQLIIADEIDMQSSGGTGYGIVRCGNLELYDAHPTTLVSPELHFRVVVDEGFSGFMIDYHSTDAVLRFRNREVPANLMTLGDSGVLTLYNDLWIPAGYEANFGTPNTAYIKRSSGAPYDLTFYDTNVGAEKTLSQLVMGGMPSSPVQGDVIYYSGTAWARLAPGTNGHFLQTQGAAANPQWAVGGDGMPINPVQGDIIYYDGANWVRLAPGTSGHFLKTQGAAANPVWAAGSSGYVTNPMSANLDADGYTINDLGQIDFRTSIATYAYINFDSTDYLRYDCSSGNDKFEFGIGGNTRFDIELEEINAYYNLDMNSKDVIKCKDIKGQTTGTDGANRLNLDFRGDGHHRLYYTGVADNRMKYETVTGHLFSVNTADICQVHAAGINMASGKYIKSDSGDLELRVPTGSSIKFTAV